MKKLPHIRYNDLSYKFKSQNQKNGVECGVFVCRYAYNLLLMRNQKFTWDDFNDDFNSLVTKGPAFQFDKSDIARIRKEIRKLINNLSKHYLRMKDQEEENEKETSDISMTLAMHDTYSFSIPPMELGKSDINKRDSTSSYDLSVTEGSSNKSDDKKDDRKVKGVEQNKSQSRLSKHYLRTKDQEEVNKKRSNGSDSNKRDSQPRRVSKRLIRAKKNNESELTQMAFARMERDGERKLLSKFKQTSAGSRLIKKE